MSNNPFEFFNLEPRFALDVRALDLKYFEMQKKSHPDQVQGKETFSSDLNTAYQTLKNPVRRAAALLEMVGVPVPGKDKAENGTESVTSEIILMEILDFQEAISVCEDAEEAEYIQSELEGMFSEEQHGFNDAFDRGEMDALPDHYVRLCYLDRLKKQLGEVKQQFFYVEEVLH